MQHSCSNLPFDSSDRARRSWSQIWYGEDLGDRSEQDNAGETCVDRGSEQVCLAPCGMGCPSGFQCSDDVCVPNLGTCTQTRLALGAAACTADTDCVPLGTAAAAGTCDATAMQCLAACADGISCPGALVCDGATEAFCR